MRAMQQTLVLIAAPHRQALDDSMVAAAREVQLSVPLVVRLEGTNVDLGKAIMAKSNLPIIAADNLADAAEKIVKAVQEGG